MQQALGLTAFQQPLSTFSIPIPEPTEHQVLIKVIAAGLNPVDAKLPKTDGARGARLLRAFPAPLGFEVSGTVARRGARVSGVDVGAVVFGQVFGSLCEFVCVDARHVARVPGRVSPVAAGAVGLNALTTACALFSPQGFAFPMPGSPAAAAFGFAGKQIVVLGAGSSNGKLGVQMARLAGFGTIVAVAGARNEAELKEYGATHVVDRARPDVAATVRALTNNSARYVYDTIMGDPALPAALFDPVAGGTLVNIVGPANAIIPEGSPVVEKKIFASSAMHPDFGAALWEALPLWLERGDVHLPRHMAVIEGFDVNAVAAAFEDILSNGGTRYVVKISDAPEN